MDVKDVKYPVNTGQAVIFKTLSLSLSHTHTHTHTHVKIKKLYYPITSNEGPEGEWRPYSSTLSLTSALDEVGKNRIERKTRLKVYILSSMYYISLTSI